MLKIPSIKCRKVAVVILNYNGKKYLEEFLPSLAATDYDDFDLVYVDNASTDDSLTYVKTNYPSIKTIEIKVNKGFTNGYAESLPQIDAEYYVLINSDVEVEKNWIRPVIDLMEKDKTIAACQPKIRSQRAKKYFEYAGAAGGYLDYLGYAFCRGRVFHELEEDQGQYDSVSEIFWASGACMFVRSEIYNRLGGLDNDFYAHMEEIDLCWRMKIAGYKIMACPASIVYHVGGSVISYGSYSKLFRNFRNSLIMLVKNLPAHKLIWILPFRLSLDGLAAFMGLVSGKPVEFRAVLMAHLSFYAGFFTWLKKRKKVQAHRNNPNNQAIYPHAIVWQFFIKGKRKFSELNLK